MKKMLFALLVMGVGLNANSQVVYQDFSTNPINIDGSNSEYSLSFFAGEEAFMIQNYSSYGEAIYFASMMSGSAVVSTEADYNANVDALTEGTTIGSNSTFFGYDDTQSPYFNILYLPNEYMFGENMSGDKYVGFKFQHSNNTYYGWAEISLEEDNGNYKVVLSAYAYQSTPNTPIKAGDKGLSTVKDIFSDISLSVYPNPVSEVVCLKTNQRIDNVEVVNCLGQRVFIADRVENIDVSNLDKGLYLLNIQSEGNTITRKFVKR